MAKAEKNVPEPKEPAKGGGLKAWLVMGLIGLISGATGFAVPMVFLNKNQEKAAGSMSQNPETTTEEGASSENESTKLVAMRRESASGQPAFVFFGDVVVNLAEEKMTRYLRISLTLQVDASNEDIVKKAVEKKKTILKNWLIGYLSDKELDEVRGAIGVHKTRREIQDQFNRLLFPEGGDPIQEVLFEDFTVT